MTDHPMIVAMAKAMAPSCWEPFKAHKHGSPVNREAAQRMHLKNARAALTALLEPTTDMLQAAGSAEIDFAAYPAANDRVIWQAMINHILTSQGE